MEEKVKCKICGKIGLAKDYKGLNRHLRLNHNICISNDHCKNKYYETADADAVVEISSITRKAFRKLKNLKWKRDNNDKKVKGRQYIRIIYTPMTNG